MTFCLRADTADSDSIDLAFCELRDQPGLPLDFGSLTNAAKWSIIGDACWGPETVTRFLRLRAKRRNIRSFGGSLSGRLRRATLLELLCLYRTSCCPGPDWGYSSPRRDCPPAPGVRAIYRARRESRDFTRISDGLALSICQISRPRT